MRLLTRNGIDWSGRFPLIAAAAGDLKVRSCLIDGEAVACDGDGLPSFDRLRYRRQDSTVFLYAFDLLGIRDRGGCAPLRHSRRVGVGIERCALYATDNQESEPRGIKKSPFSLCDCLCSGILSLERSGLRSDHCGAYFQGGYIMLKILTALAASLAMLSAAAAADLPRREPPPPAPAPVGKYPVGKAPIGKYPPPAPVVTKG